MLSQSFYVPRVHVYSNDAFFAILIDDNNAWHVHSFAGSAKAGMEFLWRMLPGKPFVTYDRFGRRKVRSMALLAERLGVDVSAS